MPVPVPVLVLVLVVLINDIFPRRSHWTLRGINLATCISKDGLVGCLFNAQSHGWKQ